jgi:hypothetical protein
MNALTIIYWTRVLLGIVAALLCTLFNELVGGISILNGISIALLVYIITYYVYKARFLTKVEKRSKLFSTGVGAYFFTWIVMFALMFTLVSPTLTITSPTRGATFTSGEPIAIFAKIASPLGVSFSGADLTAIAVSREDPAKNSTIYLKEDTGSLGTYSGTFNISSSDPSGEWTIRVQAVLNGRYREASVTVEHTV